MNSGSVCPNHHYTDGCFEMVNTPENYISAVSEYLYKLWDEPIDKDLHDLYVLLVVVRGAHVTLEDVHDAWAVWKNNYDVGHISLVPFDELSDEVKALDKYYADMIRKCAAEINPRQIHF